MKKPFREFVASEVARILAEERDRRGYSINEVSERSGLSRTMIRLVEREDRKFTLDTLMRMTEALGVDFLDVLKRAKEAASRRTAS